MELQRWCSCGLAVSGLLLPTRLARRWLTGLDEQVFDELGRLHLIELLDADTEELLGKILGILFGDVGIFVDDPKDETPLTIGAVPGITDSFWLLVLTVAVLTIITAELVCSSILLGALMTVPIGVRTFIGFRNEAGMLNFLIDAVLQKGVKLLHFDLDLGDVGQFDFDGSAETVAAVLGQPEFFAVIGAEFDGHDVGCVRGGLRCGHEKARPCWTWLQRA